MADIQKVQIDGVNYDINPHVLQGLTSITSSLGSVVYTNSAEYPQIAFGMKASGGITGPKVTSGYSAIAVGASTEAEGAASLATGILTAARGSGSFSTGESTVAAGRASFAAGFNVDTKGYDYAIALGTGLQAARWSQIVLGRYNKADYSSYLVIGNGADEKSQHNILTADSSKIAIDGTLQLAVDRSLVIGNQLPNKFTNSISIGKYTYIDTADRSIIVGDNHTSVKANCSFITGYNNTANATYNIVADGKVRDVYYTTLIGSSNKLTVPTGNTLKGSKNIQIANCQTVFGYNNITHTKGVLGATVFGKYSKNDETNGSAYLVTVGNGKSASTRSNCFAVDTAGNVIDNSAITTGYDYAEMFEWKDGNPAQEDRIGYVVTLNGDKISLCSAADKAIGIISGTSSVIGDSAHLDWKNRYLTDDFGRIIYEQQEVFIEVPDSETQEPILQSCGFETVPKVNPDYNPDEVYIPRKNRPEWAIVGLLGKIYTRDDGTCVPGGYGKPTDGGILTHSDEETHFYIMKRTSDNIVLTFLK